ncbi:MAG TPA: hypothetical protein VII94_02290 [Candidatus Saccharimonadales bacterium]
MNTINKGQVNMVFIRDPIKDEFIGFCYEFAIVKYGDDLFDLKNDLIEASKGYLEAVSKIKASDKLLNMSDKLPSEFRDLYKVMRFEGKTKLRSDRLPKQFSNSYKVGNAFLVPACV